MNPLWILFGIVIISYLVYITVSYTLLPTNSIGSSRIGPEQIDISSKIPAVISSEQLNNAWNTKEGSTLMFFVFPEVRDRTSVSGNEYANLVQIGNSQTFKILAAPDAGRGYAMAPAILEVYVKGSDTPENIELLNFPLQRWTSVVIVKDGRKFNIYINGFLKVTHMCTAMPDFDTTQPLAVGDVRLGGSIALMSLVSYPMMADEVRSYVAKSADTTGKPYLSSGLGFPLPVIDGIFGLISCPGGNCVTPIQTGPLEQWSSPYA
jgi:hypothetical protein